MADHGDTLYVATTRPAMKFGVPIEGLFINGVFTYLAYIWIGHGNIYRMAACVLIFPILHMPMRVLTSIDHNIFRILRLSLENGISFPTKGWGGTLLHALPHRLPKSEREVAGSV
jgi:type IV secretory pathway VirB3-like protein